jgi:hypothetical protein
MSATPGIHRMVPCAGTAATASPKIAMAAARRFVAVMRVRVGRMVGCMGSPDVVRRDEVLSGDSDRTV